MKGATCGVDGQVRFRAPVLLSWPFHYVVLFFVWVGVGDGDAEITSLLYDTCNMPSFLCLLQKMAMTCSNRPSGNWLTTSIWMSRGISCYLGILGFLHVLRRLAGAFEALCDVLGKAAMQHLGFGSESATSMTSDKKIYRKTGPWWFLQLGIGVCGVSTLQILEQTKTDVPVHLL